MEQLDCQIVKGQKPLWSGYFFWKVVEMPRENRVGNVEKEKRIYEVSLLLRRKSVKFIIQYITKEWDIKIDQAYNYIHLAKEEWKKYFENVKNCGMGYHVAQIRDLKDKILEKQTLNKDDYRLILDVYKEESKLLDAYPKEKIEHSGEVKVDLNLEGMEIGEIRRLIRALETHTGAKGQGGTEKEGDKGKPI